ncbi:hypothetical protein [Paenibacillus chungangensis]|uniref:Uncharacterized protein n=1 Tax=Paenibacillus chungangensis TaxID=696535 RepID=A0ABW3HQV9_9BACL
MRTRIGSLGIWLLSFLMAVGILPLSASATGSGWTLIEMERHEFEETAVGGIPRSAGQRRSGCRYGSGICRRCQKLAH